MRRLVSGELQAWKKSEPHRVLLLRGARQVGKTWAVRELGRTFPHFLEINFEADLRPHAFFEHSLDARQLATKLSAYTGTPVIPGATLLFLDEIQACPRALASLRFFWEHRSEFVKYKARAPVDRLRATLESICLQAGSKFKLSAIESAASYRPRREALELLLQAGLAYRVPHSDARGVPLGAQQDPRRFKVLPFDVGILQRISGLDVAGRISAPPASS